MVNLRDSEGRNWNVQVGGNPLKPISIELGSIPKAMFSAIDESVRNIF